MYSVWLFIDNVVFLQTSKSKIMAIVIKSVPILEKSEAQRFEQQAAASLSKKASVKFTKQHQITSKILAKAKF